MKINVGDIVAVMFDDDEFGWTVSELGKVDEVMDTMIRVGTIYYNKDDKLEEVGRFSSHKISLDAADIKEAIDKSRASAIHAQNEVIACEKGSQRSGARAAEYLIGSLYRIDRSDLLAKYKDADIIEAAKRLGWKEK